MSDKIKWFLVVIALGFSIGILSVYFISKEKTENIKTEVTNDKVDETIPEPPTKKTVEEKTLKDEAPLPERIVLDVPFYSQAPYGVWDSLHKETCEEAALFMVRDYFSKTKKSLEDQDKALIDYVGKQTADGYGNDITIQQVADTAETYYDFSNYKIISNPTIKDIKKEIAAGRPVIVPAAGRVLNNPNFTSPGPIYHMLVIKGYDRAGFITNDPGTRNGNSFHYEYQNLFTAIHDWNPINIFDGDKAVLVYTG